jgi:hypothetical protein
MNKNKGKLPDIRFEVKWKQRIEIIPLPLKISPMKFGIMPIE